MAMRLYIPIYFRNLLFYKFI